VKFKAALFDLDGTLCHLATDFWLLFDNACYQVFGPELPFEVLKLREFFTVYSNQNGPVDAVGVINAGLRSFGLNYPAAPSRIVRELLTNYTAATEFVPGALEVLDALRTRGFKLGMVTNGPEDMQKATILHLNLKEKFDRIVISGMPDIGIRKPDPRIYEVALERIGAVAADSFFVGDRLDTDILGALRANLYAIWFNPTGRGLLPTDPHPDAVISDLKQLFDL